MPKIIINSVTLGETRDEITEQLVNFRREGLVGKDNPVSVVIDGKTLTFALDPSLKKDFLELCCRYLHMDSLSHVYHIGIRTWVTTGSDFEATGMG